MKKNLLLDKTKAFALRIIKLFRYLYETKMANVQPILTFC